MKNQKGIASLLAIIIVIAVGVVAIGGVLAYQYLWVPGEEVEEEEKAEEPYIKVTYPNGGEKWKWATTQEIKWEFSLEFESKIENREIISLSLDIHSEEGSWHIYREDNFDKDFTSMQWIVGNAGVMPGGFGQTPFYEEHPQPIPNEQYKIRVCGGTSESFYEICDESDDYFSIIGEEPSIIVISPNGGEEWVIGEKQIVTWDANSLDYVTIFLKHVAGDLYTIDRIYSYQGEEYSWTLGRQVANPTLPIAPPLVPGEYKIMIQGIQKAPYAYASDESDDYFSIVEE